MNNTLLQKIDFAEIGRNTPASKIAIAKANLSLKNARLPTLPTEFSELLEHYNGLSHDGAVLFGLEENTQFFPNMLAYNSMIFKNKAADFLILGYDEFFYLIYDKVDSLYKLVDKDDFQEDVTSENLEYPLCKLMRID